MIHRVITGIVGQMEKEHLIMPQEKDDYIYAYEVICEKVISLGTIVILGMLLDNLVNTVLYMLFFLTLRKRTGGFHMPTFFKCYIGSVILYLITYCSISYTYNYYVMVILLVVSILVIGVVGTTLMIALAKTFSRQAQLDNAVYCMIAIAPTVFFICISC